jgi:hypothetical protein
MNPIPQYFGEEGARGAIRTHPIIPRFAGFEAPMPASVRRLDLRKSMAGRPVRGALLRLYADPQIALCCTGEQAEGSS